MRVSTLADARSLAQRNPDLAREALESLVIGVTQFFRDAEAFDFLRDTVFPDLTGPGGYASIWSAGCSDGAELYSLAILFAEQGVLHRRRMLGTDCRALAMTRAAAGVFDVDVLRFVPSHLLVKYFHRRGAEWQIAHWLRHQMHWRRSDLLTVQEPGPWDLILCRNLSIYLQPRAVATVWYRLHDALKVGGLLMTGKAERPPAGLRLAPVGPCLYRRERSQAFAED